MPRIAPPLLLILFCPAASWAETPAATFTVAQSEDGVLISEGSTKVLFYQRKTKSFEDNYARANYVHPLYDLDGNVMTEDFPRDHRHHRGIFWAWHQTVLDGKKLGDGWATRDFVWDVRDVKVLPASEDSAAIRAQVLWKSPDWLDEEGQQKPFVQEETEIRVYRAADDARKIDFTIRLLALEKGLRIGGSENAKGYGGFSARVRLPKGVRFIGKQGEVSPQTNAVEAGPWLDIVAPFGETEAVSGLTILCHDSLPGYPQKWILRRRFSMQNPVYPGQHAAELPDQEPLVLRYRLVLHRGPTDAAKMNAWQAEYNAAKAP